MRYLYRQLTRHLALLVLLAAPSGAAVSRFYYSAMPVDFFPSPDSGWEVTSQFQWWGLYDDKSPNLAAYSSLFDITYINVSAVTTDDTLEHSFVTPPLTVGTVFTATTETVGAMVWGREVALTDDVNSCIIGIRVLASDASTVRATLLAVGDYGTHTEFQASTVITGIGRAKRCATAEAITSSYTTVAGDRLVVELGLSTTAGGTTPQGNIRHGRAPSISDCTTDNATGACQGWVEFSDTVTYEQQVEIQSITQMGSWWYPNSSYAHTATPAFDAAWTSTTGAVRRQIGRTWNGSTLLNSAVISITSGAGNNAAAFQFMSAQLAAGTAFSSSTTRVSAALGMRERASTDNVNRCIMGIRVLDADGSTIKATLLAVGQYFGTVELTPSTTNQGMMTCANHDLLTGSYTTEDGDRLLFEVGAGMSGTGTTPEFQTSYGDGDGVRVETGGATGGLCTMRAWTSSINCSGWVHLSIDAPLLDEGGPTRLYFPATTATDITPAVASGWNESSVQRRELAFADGDTAMTLGPIVTMSAVSTSRIDRQLITSALATGTVFTAEATRVYGALRGREYGTADDIRHFRIAVRVVSADGGTVRAELLPVDAYFVKYDAVYEFTNFNGISTQILAAPDTTLTASYTTVAGDRLVVEVGAWTGSVSAATRDFQLEWGEGAVADCALVRLGSSGGSSTCTGWIEFSNNILAAAIGGTRGAIIVN